LNSVPTIAVQLDGIRSSHLVESVQILGQGRQVIKARIYISADLFVQVYRNDRFGTTNFAVILSQRRIFGRDERGGKWHRHPSDDPEAHDESEEGRREVSLSEFWVTRRERRPTGSSSCPTPLPVCLPSQTASPIPGRFAVLPPRSPAARSPVPSTQTTRSW